MIDSTILNEAQLARIYLVANTPSYLLRHYRADTSVLELAKRNSVDDLISFALHNANTSEAAAKLKGIVFAYAAIVALTFKNQREVSEKTANVSFENLDWAHRILEIGGYERTGNVRIDVNVPPRIEQRSPQSSSVNSAIVPIEVR